MGINDSVTISRSFNDNVQHFTTCAALHTCHYAANGRNKFQFRMILVDKQGSSGHHIFLFFDYYLRSNTRKIFRNQCVESRFFHRHKLLRSLTFQVDVKAFT